MLLAVARRPASGKGVEVRTRLGRIFREKECPPESLQSCPKSSPGVLGEFGASRSCPQSCRICCRIPLCTSFRHNFSVELSRILERTRRNRPEPSGSSPSSFGGSASSATGFELWFHRLQSSW